MKLNTKIRFKDRVGFIILYIRDLYLKSISLSYKTFSLTFRYLSPKYVQWSSRIRAKRAYYLALKNVPAYKDFASKYEDIIPETDKKNYILAYSTEERCIGGQIPHKKTAIDESSGSTGTPYNWVRSLKERRESHHFISFFAKYCYGDSVDIAINAFSLGAWATGLNMGAALEKNFIVKNTGPDLEKIFHTLTFFGPKHRYLIVGYPPFLKWFIDVAHERKFPIQDYNLQALVGGEGMSEGLRDYLYKSFKSVFSGYGATDLEIGVAGETPVSIAIRRLAYKDPKVRKSLFGDDSRLPMVFQYNPLMHYMEINEKGELICTITRNSILSPRIRYNIHDQAGILRYDQMKVALKENGYDINKVETTSDFQFNLPFVWIYGRQDFTISIMGANIYPEDIEQFIYGSGELSQNIRSFCQTVVESEDGDARPGFYFELKSNLSVELKDKFKSLLIEHLKSVNKDFNEAWHEHPQALDPVIEFFNLGEGPFAKDSSKIKQTRMI